MYAPANQPPDFHYKFNASHQKLTVWVGLCGNNNMLDISVIYLLTVLSQRYFPCVIFHENRLQRLCYAQDGATFHGLLAVCARLNQLFGERL